jgi:hypothetical protein
MCTDESAAIGAEERTRRAAALEVFTEQMTARGTLLASEQLHRTETAATVRCWDGGDVMISDGPFAETKEQIAGLFIVECKDLEEAIEVATTVPAAWYGTVEVRPVRQA